MSKPSLFKSVSLASIAIGLWATPAHANDGNDEVQGPIERPDEWVSEASGSFEGFRLPLSIGQDWQSDLIRLAPSILQNGERELPVQPDPRILVRDDVGLERAIDSEDTLPSVVQLFTLDLRFGIIFPSCTGTLINPRTVLTAAHCVNGDPLFEVPRSSEEYTAPFEGPISVMVGTGVDTSARYEAFRTMGRDYSDGGLAGSSDVITHASSNPGDGGLPFPWADIALIALDEPITDVPSMPLLLSPLDQLTHMVVVGYGTFGTGETGAQGSGNLRRIGENMLGAIGSLADLYDVALPAFAPTRDFGISTQSYYWFDFDDPDRQPGDTDGCNLADRFDAIICDPIGDYDAIDWFEGDALPNEVGTAPGDSGSPLIADQLTDFSLITAVLSGGVDFSDGRTSTFADISFYNPLYPFFEFLTENTPYKYVSANTGNWNWSNPDAWTQDLDPGFFIRDENGNYVNGVPGGSERGIYETGPKLGTILGVDISEFSDETILPPEDNTLFAGPNTPNSSVLLGPGSTGFVPQNTDGIVGTSFENPAQYFEVHLNNTGHMTVDVDVEIDKLSISNGRLTVPATRTFETIIGFEQLGGVSSLSGNLIAPTVGVFGGVMEASGTITTDTFANIAGLLSIGSRSVLTTLTIDGDFLQSSGGTLLANFWDSRRSLSRDFVDVSGTASLAGRLILSELRYRARYGDEFTLLSAGGIEGNFDEVDLLSRSPILFAETQVDGTDLVVSLAANEIAEVVGAGSSLVSLGTTLDRIRFSGRSSRFAHLFDIVDHAGIETLGATLASLTPQSAFEISSLATSFSQRFTGQIGQRTLALRGGNRAEGAFTAAGNAAFAIAGTSTDASANRLGFFGSVSGVFLNPGEQSENPGFSAFEATQIAPAGELTLGADYRAADNLSIGIAFTTIQNSDASVSALRPQQDRSRAFAAYAAYKVGHGFIDAYAGTAEQEFGIERSSQGDFAGLFSTALGATEGKQTFAGLRLGYSAPILKGLEVGPVVSVDYVRNAIGAYTEYGAGQYGLSVAARDFTSLGAKVGAMGVLDLPVGRSGSLTAFGSVAYARELASAQDVITAHFVGAADAPFTLANPLDPEWVSVSAGAELALKNNLSASLSMTSDIGRGVLSNDQGQISLSWRF